MLRLLFLIALVLCGGVALSYLHSYPNSYLLLTLGAISVETSLGVALALFLLAALLLWLLASLLGGLVSIPGGIAGNWRWWRGKHRRGLLNQLALKLNSGEHKDTDKLLRGLTDKELGDFERLALAVRARLESGSPSSAGPLLDQLESQVESREHKEHCMRLRAEYWLKNGEFKHLCGLELPGRLQRQRFWRQAIATAAVATDNWELLYRQLKADYNLPRKFWVQALQHSDNDKLLDRVWSNTPSALKDQPALTRIYLERLIATGRPGAAQNLLLAASEKPSLFALLPFLGNFKPQHPEKLLQRLEKRYTDFRANHLHEDAGYFALGLGKLCLRLELTGKAEDYLASLVDHANPDISRQANLAMAQLLAARDQLAPAMEHVIALNQADTPPYLHNQTTPGQ